MRAALYVRVSTQEQKNHGLSVDSQIQALNDYCQANGITVAGLYNDAGISARKRYTYRPAILNLMKDCADHKFDIVLFTKLDRWFRSVADYYQVQSVLDQHHIPWKAIWEDYETVTSSGQFKVNIMLSIAQAEADRTSERIKAVNDFKRASGHYVGGKAPTGYHITGKDLVIDESKRMAVSLFFDELLSSFDIARAVNVLHTNGVMITRETATRMIKNPTYSGETASGYKCPAYITSDQQNLIIDKMCMKHTRIPKDHNRVYLFAGLIRCPVCGGAMSGRFRSIKGPNKKYYSNYYQCNKARNMICSNSRSVSERKIEKYLLSNVDQNLRTFISDSYLSVSSSDHSAEISKLEAKLKRVGVRYEDGDISTEEYREKRNSIRSSIAELRSRSVITRIPEPLPEGWDDIYADLDAPHRKMFWANVLSKITICGDDIHLFF